MTLASQMANDWQFIDGVEDVSVTPRNPAGAAVTGVKALRRVQQADEFAQVGKTLGLEPNDMVWHLWASTMAGISPKNGDIITDSGGIVWTIKTVANTTLGTRWRTLCRRQATA